MLLLMVIAYLAVIGLCFGSFVNALVWRIHMQSQKKLSTKQRRDYSMLHGRSMCSLCQHPLVWYDLLPAVSWLSLRGKCRYCRKPIADNPLVEVVTSSLFIMSYIHWPYEWSLAGLVSFGLWLALVVGFVALTVYDLRWMLLPDRVVVWLQFLTALLVLVRIAVADNPWPTALAAFWGFMAIGGVFYGLYQLSGGTWIGGGDVKIAFFIGPLVGGPLFALLVIFLASIGGTLVSLPFIVQRKLGAGSRIPFGPFLLAATYIMFLHGDALVSWYMNMLTL